MILVDSLWGKVTTIRNEVDSQSINSSLSTTTCTQSSPVTCLFSEFRLMTNEELLIVIKKCPNKSCALDPMPTWLVVDWFCGLPE